jgi:hypothetical protein
MGPVIGSLTMMWLVGALVVVGWAITAYLLVRSDTTMPPVLDVPRASLRILFVCEEDGVFVVDGLLDVEGARAGIPTTWRLEPPWSELVHELTRRALERWSDETAPVDVELHRSSGAPPSVSLAYGDTSMRLAFTARRPSHH